MNAKKNIVALIPVKGNSERVKGKNIRPFGDTTLLELKLKQLKEVDGFADLIVSSEDESILETAKKYDFSIHKRDPKYSTSHVPMSEVYSYIASEINGDDIAWINVTNPLADSQIYLNAIKEYESMPNNCDCLLSVFEMQDYFFYKNTPLNFKAYPWAKSQDLEPLLSMSFIINILKREDMINWGSCVGDSPHFYIVDQLSSWDIDFQVDFDFCESIYLDRLSKQ